MAKKNVFNNYEILKPGARIKKGDQFYSSDSRGWFNAEPPDIGLTVSQYGGLRVRRPKPTGPQYKKLTGKDVIQVGDEYYNPQGSFEWVPMVPVSWGNGMLCSQFPDFKWRRPV